jgi:hypothetical protein
MSKADDLGTPEGKTQDAPPVAGEILKPVTRLGAGESHRRRDARLQGSLE